MKAKPRSLADFHTFANWETLLAFVRSGRPMYYHAPLDYFPRLVRGTLGVNGTVLVLPYSSDCDPFEADAAHLDRFRFRLEVQP